MTDDWLARATAAWRYNALPAQTPLVVGVSGGVDSLALLHLLTQRGGHSAAHITAVYVHHGLRPEAEQEGALVAELAQQWGAASRVVRVAAAVSQTTAVEDSARRARYHALGQVASELGTHHVAVAHHADDQAETVLMNLLRGTGLNGLRGMIGCAPLPEWGAPYQLWRPLLGVWRSQLADYAHHHALPVVQDSMNEDPRFLRGRVRHQLLPYLQEYNPQIARHLAQVADLAAADYEVVGTAARTAWDQIAQPHPTLPVVSLDGPAWRTLPLALRRETLRHAVAHAVGHLRDGNFELLETARQRLEQGGLGVQVALAQGVQAQVHYDEVLVVWAGGTAVLADWLAQTRPQLADQHPQQIAIPSQIALRNGWYLTADWHPTAELDAVYTNHDPWQAFVAVPATGSLWLRPRQAGERFQPLGLGGHTKLKKVMMACHIPAAVRDRWPVVADGAGVLWLVGHSLAERAAVGEATTAVVRLRVGRESER